MSSTGRFKDRAEPDDQDWSSSKVNNVGWWFKPWYYVHVRDFLDRIDDLRIKHLANDTIQVICNEAVRRRFRPHGG